MCVERIVSSTFLHMLNSNHVRSQRFPEVYTECYIRFLVFETSGCGVETSGIHFPRFRGGALQDRISCPSERYGAIRGMQFREGRLSHAVTAIRVATLLAWMTFCWTRPRFESCHRCLFRNCRADPIAISKRKRNKKIGKEEETELVVVPARDLSRSLSPYRAMHHKRTRNNLLHLVRIYGVSQRMRKLNSICSKSICMKCIFLN